MLGWPTYQGLRRFFSGTDRTASRGQLHARGVVMMSVIRQQERIHVFVLVYASVTAED